MNDFYSSVMEAVANAAGALPVSFPGSQFDPVKSNTKTWLRVDLFDAEPDSAGLANDAGSTQRGILQIQVNGRPSEYLSMVPLREVAKTVIEAFPKGTQLYANIRVTRDPFIESVAETPDRLIVPVRIPYSA